MNMQMLRKVMYLTNKRRFNNDNDCEFTNQTN